MAVNQIILQSKMKAGAKVAYTCWLSNSTAILGLKVGWGQFENVILHSFFRLYLFGYCFFGGY